jgi:hypothetical protein
MTTTDQIITYARARFEHAAARKLIQEKYQARMLFAAQGGMWRAGPELLNILATVPPGDAVLLDLYETPVRVRPEELRDQAMCRWQEQMNAWLVEYEQLNQNR